jgi:hypothetical protein
VEEIMRRYGLDPKDAPKAIEKGDYTAAPDTVATWFVDPPYEASEKPRASPAARTERCRG